MFLLNLSKSAVVVVDSSGPRHNQAKFKSCSIRSWAWLPGHCEHQRPAAVMADFTCSERPGAVMADFTCSERPGAVMADFTCSETRGRISSKMGASSFRSALSSHCSLLFALPLDNLSTHMIFTPLTPKSMLLSQASLSNSSSDPQHLHLGFLHKESGNEHL